MKIISLKAENFKRLVAVEIDPSGNMVEIRGKNGSGKSSVLDSISAALEGLAAVPGKPIRDGQNQAWIELDLGDYKVTRTFKTDETGTFTSSLKVEGQDGKNISSPQKVIDGLIGRLSFNPLEFADADKNQQIELIKSLVKGFDFKANEKAEADAYEERTIVNRKVKDSSLKHVSFKDVPVAEPEMVDVKALTNQMAKASESNVEIEKVKSERAKLDKENITDKVVTRARLNKEYNAIKENAEEEFQKAEKAFKAATEKVQQARDQDIVNGQILASIQKEINKALEDQKNYAQLPDPIDVSIIKNQLDEATSKNDLHDKWKQKNEAKLEIEEYEKQSNELTKKIEDLQVARLNAVKNSGLPVEGLQFNNEGVNLNGIPFDQASASERLRTSVALAMAQNPTIKVIRIMDGALLDADGLKMIAEMADKNDCQVWIEIVDSTGKVGFVMEDGSLKQ